MGIDNFFGRSGNLKKLTLILLVVLLLVSCTPSPPSDNKLEPSSGIGGANDLEYYTSNIGMWYCVWWDSEEKDPKFFDWHWIKETRVKPVKHGYYATDDPIKLEDDFTYFNEIGIDFLVLDNTNGHFSDEGNIAAHIEACFKMAQKLGDKSPKLSFAGGGPLYLGNESGMKDELDLFYTYANNRYKDNYFYWKGKPLVVFFVGPHNYGYKDDRYTIRLASGHVSESVPVKDQYHIEKNGLWGWVYDMQYEDSEIFGINPGWSRSHNNLHTSKEPTSRDNGKRYISMWLEAIKNNPEVIMIASWNDHAEETGIEAVQLLEPIEGRENEMDDPYFYQKVTEGYLALRTGFLEGWYYRLESDDTVYKYTNGILNKVEEPDNEVVIVVPDDYFAWSGVKVK